MDDEWDEREVIKGRLLSRWLDELRADQRPTYSPAQELLTPAEVDEVMALARWWKGLMWPTPIDPDRVNRLLPRLMERVRADLARRNKERALKEEAG